MEDRQLIKWLIFSILKHVIIIMQIWHQKFLKGFLVKINKKNQHIY